MVDPLLLAVGLPRDTHRELATLFNNFIFFLNQLGSVLLSTPKNVDWYNR